MDITSAQYNEELGETNIKAVMNGETHFVPLDPANRHYQAIQEWVAEGNTIQPAE